MSEKQFKSELCNKFFIELEKNEHINKETFYNSKFHLIDYYELEGKKESITCTCGIKILNIYVLRSDILNKEIIIGSECLNNFEKDQDILNNTFVKKCLLCQNLNMGKNRSICNDCKKRDKCIKCKSFVPKKPFKMCNFCTFKQVPINEGKQILGRYGNIPIYILYGKYGPYLNWFDKNISIPISLELAIHLIKFKHQMSAS